MATLQISDELYSEIVAKARRNATSVEGLIRSAVASAPDAGPALVQGSPEWREELHRFASAHPRPAAAADDSREAIYGDRENAQL